MSSSQISLLARQGWPQNYNEYFLFLIITKIKYLNYCNTSSKLFSLLKQIFFYHIITPSNFIPYIQFLMKSHKLINLLLLQEWLLFYPQPGLTFFLFNLLGLFSFNLCSELIKVGLSICIFLWFEHFLSNR